MEQVCELWRSVDTIHPVTMRSADMPATHAFTKRATEEQLSGLAWEIVVIAGESNEWWGGKQRVSDHGSSAE